LGVIARDAEEARMATLQRPAAQEPTLHAHRRSGLRGRGPGITGSGKVLRVLSRTNMSLDDAGGRDVSLSRVTGVLNGREPDFDDVSVVAVEFSDCAAGAGVHRGHAVNTHPGGDKTFVAYEGAIRDDGTTNGPVRRTFEGQWWYLAGTGKFADIAGKGTYRGVVGSGGPVFTFEGEWSIAGASAPREGLSATA